MDRLLWITPFYDPATLPAETVLLASISSGASRTRFPTTRPLSRSAFARAASSNGNTPLMTGRILRSSASGSEDAVRVGIANDLVKLQQIDAVGLQAFQ